MIAKTLEYFPITKVLNSQEVKMLLQHSHHFIVLLTINIAGTASCANTILPHHTRSTEGHSNLRRFKPVTPNWRYAVQNNIIVAQPAEQYLEVEKVSQQRLIKQKKLDFRPAGVPHPNIMKFGN